MFGTNYCVCLPMCVCASEDYWFLGTSEYLSSVSLFFFQAILRMYLYRKAVSQADWINVVLNKFLCFFLILSKFVSYNLFAFFRTGSS